MDAKLGDEINYKPTLKRDPYYKYTKVIQNVGSESVTISNSAVVSTFEIPVVGFNFAKSYLNFDQTAAAQPDVDAVTKSSNLYRNVPPFSRVEVLNRAGVSLCDITNFAQFCLATTQRTQEIEEYHADTNSILRRIGLNNLGTLGSLKSAANTAQTVEWRIPGKHIYNTVLSLDKSLFMGEVIQLRITWLPSTHHGWSSNSADADAGIADLGGDITINNLSYYLAQEQNPLVLADLQQTVAQGELSLIIPYVHHYKTNISNSATHAISIRAMSAHGFALERLSTLFVTGAEEKSTRYDADIEAKHTVGGVANTPMFNSFYSLLDSRRIMDSDVDVKTKMYHWLRRDEQAGRVVSLDKVNDSVRFAWTDNWCGDSMECAVKQHIGGLPLDQERKYDIYVNCSGTPTVNYYSSLVCQKRLSISAAGVQVL